MKYKNKKEEEMTVQSQLSGFFATISVCICDFGHGLRLYIDLICTTQEKERDTTQEKERKK